MTVIKIFVRNKIIAVIKISVNPLALKNLITQKISGDLKSGDSLFFYVPLPNFNGPLQQIEPAPNVNGLGQSNVK